MERGLDPMTTNLVVADISRTEKTICLAVSPALKAYGIPGRARLFEVLERVKEVNAERRREESAIVIKATDRYSETVKRKGETTKSFGKNLDKTEDILTLLSKNKATIRVDVKQAKSALQDAEKQFAKTRSEADKLKLETAQADYDNMVRNLKSVTKAAGDTEKAISKIEDTATGSSNAFSGIVGAIAQTGITKLVGDAALDAR